ncbi:MAG: flagella synthesis protein FlgN [Gammaproteobacteria bacterium]
MNIEKQDLNIKDIFQNEITLSHRLLDILKREYAALTSNNTDAIEQVIERKVETINQLEKLGTLRMGIINKAGFSPDKNGIVNFIKGRDPHIGKTLYQCWQQLLDLGRKCKMQNEVNGTIIQASYMFTQRALGILHGQLPGDELRYGPDGKTHNGNQSSALAKA